MHTLFSGKVKYSCQLTDCRLPAQLNRASQECIFLSTDLKNTVRHDDVGGENFVRQNHILCIIYTQMCVIRNTNIINRLPAINCRPQHPTLTVMLHFPQQLTGQHDEVNCVIIGHVAIDHALEQTGGCQDIAAFTGQCLAHQQVPLPTGMYNMYNGASMKTERATLICNIHTRNMQLYTVCNPANMYTQHVTLSVSTHSV